MAFSLAKIGRKSLITAAVIAVSCGVTYYVNEKKNESRLSDLEAQVDSLNEKVLQARVTQRISEQMGDIASQQSKISELERNRAEKQSLIAEQERGKAEVERGLAMEAQQKALASAREAKLAQTEAEKQSQLATQNMLIAQEARAHADTLMYISLSNSMAQSALSQNGSDNSLAKMLSYAAWMFNEKYNSTPSGMQNIYDALLLSSNPSTSIGMKGNIRKLHVIDNCLYGVSDYGEVIFASGDAKSLRSVNIGSFDFRDFYGYNKKRMLALASDGKVYVIDLSNIETAKSAKDIPHYVGVQLPSGVWKRLNGTSNENILLAMSDNMVAWIDNKTLSVIATAKTASRPTCIGKQGKMMHIFCEKGVHYVSDTPGVLAQVDLKLNTINSADNYVTSYIYNKERKLHVLGTSNGYIAIYDDQGKNICNLTTDWCAITELHVWDELLFSTGYDKTLRIWNISDLNSLITPVSKSYDNWLLTFDINTKSNDIWIGTANGTISSFCFDIDQNAESARKSITREFTPEEWNRFVGKGVERQNLMK